MIETLLSQLEKQHTTLESLASGIETLSNAEKRSSLAQSVLSSRNVSLIYGLVYMQTFAAWEFFVEESLCYFLMHKRTKTGHVDVSKVGHLRDREAARAAVLGGKDYVSWANVGVALDRFRAVVNNGRHEQVFLSASSTLSNLAAIRHAVAHSSKHSVEAFRKAALAEGASPASVKSVGDFLRSTRDADDRSKWLYHLNAKLFNLAKQIGA